MVLYELYTLDGMARSSDFHIYRRRVRGAEVPLETSRVGNEKWVCVCADFVDATREVFKDYASRL